MEEPQEGLAEHSLQLVNQYKNAENFGRAFAHYLVYLELNPSADLSEHEKPFSEILATWCVEMESRNEMENICKCYMQGLHYFPNSIAILNSFGGHLLRFNQPQDALTKFKKATLIDANHLPSEKNLASAKAAVVEQWHFRMLNDRVRNLGYFQAFQKLLQESNNFAIDIGTGSGILSLLASKVYNERNLKNFQIVAFELSGTLANIATEVFKANGYEKHVTVINAASTSLNKVNYGETTRKMVLFTEIFDTALFGEHVLSTLIHAHQNLLCSSEHLNVIPATADLYIFGAACPALYLNKKLQKGAISKLKMPSCDIKVNFDNLEPYDAYDISKCDFKQVTNLHKVLTVDFNDVDLLQELYSNENAIPAFDLRFSKDNLLCDCFIIFFDLNLAPDVSISTNPFLKGNPCKCWEQAIIYIEEPILTAQGSSINDITISVVNNKLTLSFPCRESDDSFLIEEESVKFLNDKELMLALEHSAEKLQVDREYSILDLHPVPIFGLLACLKVKDAVHLTTTSKQRKLVERLCTLNKISVKNITFVDDGNLFEHFYLTNECFDIIIFNPVLKNGVLNEEFYSKCNIFRSVLNKNGFFLPTDVSVKWQLVQSDYLDICTKVSDENVMNFNIAQFINEFSVLEVWDLNVNFSFSKLSELQKTAIQLMEEQTNTECNVVFNETNAAESVKANSTYYFFEMDFLGFQLCTGTSPTSFPSIAAFVFEKPVDVNKKEATFFIKQHAGLLKIYPKE